VTGASRIELAGEATGVADRSRATSAQAASHLVLFVSLVGVCALLLCAGLGYGLAKASDERSAAEQRASLRAALQQFPSDNFDAGAVSAIARSSGLKGLKFEAGPGGRFRLSQPILSGGRIRGFLTWDQRRPLTRVMDYLMPVIGALIAGLIGFAGFSVWRLRRLQGEQVERAVAAARPSKPALNPVTDEEQFIRRELPRAMTGGEMHLHYQPIVSAQGAHIVGVEALLRWTHPHRGPIGPAAFIPVAEKMGLIDKLGAFVLRRALAEAKRWPGIYVGVNLSPLQVRDRTIIDLVRTTLAETGIEPARLMLEITEGVLIDNPEEMLERIADLHDLGVRIALDDFGSGYSSLGYLQRFPIDKLKIDRSFVTALDRQSNGGVIVQAITALGRALGISVLAEGVETEEQRVLLRLAGCSEMQGYLFGRPGPAFMIDRLLAESEAVPTAPAPAFAQPLTA
jgi:EAL domain-containing protein (putative c-di-GMP-specific phosphodiesterase class I)